MTPRTHRRLIVGFALYLVALLSVPSPARAEDIDIFSINPNVSSLRPNVLIILDTSANWSSPDPVTGGTKYESVRAALSSTINGLDEKFNIGLMMYAETGGGNDSIDGGVVRAAVRNMSVANKPKYVAFFNSVNGNFDKTNNTSMGLAFAEAYYYFTGQTAVSGFGKLKRDYFNNAMPTDLVPGNANNNSTLAQSNAIWALTGNAFTGGGVSTYTSPMSDACQKNFIIYIANGTVTDNTANNSDATSKLAAAGGDTTTIVFAQNDGDQANISDEWARFLASADLRPDATNPTLPGKQTITTYTVEVNPGDSNQQKDNTELLKSIANQGKGKYFGVTSATVGGVQGANITEALNKIFAEVLAVNSVFASSTLPVSVNVRGTFLNQVYMGVFRPDANSSPRWPGNVKQYTLKPTGSGDLFLADKDGNPVENTATGFLSPSAKSFWTHNPVAPLTGFWDLTYYPDAKAQPPLVATTSDMPDGEFVEKGGAAQHLRDVHRTVVTGRTLYTCITAAGCGPGATTLSGSADNLFNVDNTTYLTSISLGVTGATVTSLTRSGTLATADASAHGFNTGQLVSIAGANEAPYNGNFLITKVNDNRFTYVVTETPASPATTTSVLLAAKVTGTPVVVTSITRPAGGTTATVLAPGHSFAVGNSVLVQGAEAQGYVGSKTVTAADTVAGTFTFAAIETPATQATAVGTATVASIGTKNIRSSPSIFLTRSGTTVSVETTANHTFTSGDTVTIANVTPGEYNGTFSLITVTGNKTFTYVLPTSSIKPATVDPAVGVTAVAATALAVDSITRSGSTATVTTSTDPVAAGFANGNTITISGATQTEYNGAFPISSVNAAARTFTYPVTVNPPTTASTGSTITATGAGGVSRNALINWVRGENAQLDDNPTSAVGLVRGYLHGDVLHSRPSVVNYNRSGQPADRDIVVYYGANDGIIHAVKGGQDDADGDEMWGFIPTEFFDRFARLYTETPIVASASPRTYFADGPLSVDAVYVNDRLEGAGAKAQLYVGMRRGGRFYYSLDVLDPDDPVFKWKITNNTPGFAELGQSWSDPKVFTINVAYPDPAGTAAARKVLIFGAGYDAAANDPDTQVTATMGRGIFVVDATSGALIWFASPKALSDVTVPSGATYKQVSGMNFAIPADLAVINSDRDVSGFVDRIYAADTGGNIWRVNISAPDPAAWTVGQVASLGGSGANARKFLFAPDIVPFDANTDSILVGSGDREHPFDINIANRFYMIKDSHALNAQPSSVAVETDLCDLSDNNLQGTDAALAELDRTCLADSAKKGWMIALGTGEKVVTGATTLGGTTIFATNTPASQATPGQCTGSLGKALLYAVNFKDATATIDFNATGVLSSRATIRPGGGFPPTPVPVSIKIGDKYYEGAITGTQVVTPPSAPIGQRYRVFWNLNVDN